MKKVIVYLVSFFLITNCTEDKKSFPEQIAEKYGISKFNKVKNIEFVFNVQKKETSVKRHWKWYPKTDSIDFISKDTVIRFLKGKSDSKALVKLNKQFINDCYWLLFPYYLSWDKNNYKYTVTKNVQSPIKNVKATKLEITYINNDGFTPNDIYEFYLLDTQIIEWVYRKGGSKKPTKITTWENLKNYNGVQLFTEHNTSEKNFKVWFENININYYN